MKKQFSRRRNFILGRSFVGPISLSLLGIAVLFLVLRILAPGALVAIATPVWHTGTVLSASVGNGASFFTDKATLTHERDRLLAENTALKEEKATTDARVADLTRLLGTRTEAAPGILAGVLVRPPVSPYDVLIVDQGSRAGVAVGSRAEGSGGMPLGTVESVSGASARIELYSTPGRETESWVGETRLPLTLRGTGSGSFSASVAREAGVHEGDLVYLAGPGAVALGSVVSVENDPSSPRSHVAIKPFVNPFSTVWVTIVP